MRQPPALLLSAGTLIAGMMIGAGLMWLPVNRTVHAQNLDGATAERIYRELSTEGSSLQDGSTLLAKIAAVTTPSVVHIQCEKRVQGGRGKEEETGSGVILTSSKASGYFVVTNCHVVDKTAVDSISISLYDGRVIQPERVYTDAESDIAVLKIGATNVTAAKWGDSRKVDIGHMVLAMGSPFGLSRSVTLGIISARGRRKLQLGRTEVINQDFLQTDAAINPGNSGGPLIDLQGRVIGINTAIATSSGGNDGIGFSIPSYLAQRVMDQLLEHGVVPRAWIGVKLDEHFDIKVANKLKLDRAMGARVNEVYENSPASRAGLQLGDVVLNFDGFDVQDHDHLINLVSLSPIGKQIRMSVWRAQKKVTLSIVLADRSDLRKTSEAPPQQGRGVPVRPMGLIVHPLDGDLAEQLGHQRTSRGLLVLKVERGSTLSGDLEAYDVLEAVGRTPVASLEDLSQALEQNSHSESVILKIHRTAQSEAKNQLVIWHKWIASRPQ